MRSRWLLITGLALLLLVPPGAAEGQDFTITLSTDAPPVYEGPEGLVELVDETPGERLVWRLNLTADYTVAEVRIDGAFDVERPKQVVPLLEGKHFVEVRSFDVTEVDAPAKVFRLVEREDGFAYRLGIPGPTNGTLELRVDRAPPAFSIGAVERVTHYSFYVETRTTEAAYADLLTRPVGDEGDWVRHPTPAPALLQKFPVQGLDADTRYAYRFAFEDWSGNVAETETFHVQTLPEPDRPLPIVTVLSPSYNATVDPHGVQVRVAIESPESPVLEGGVRLFFDKREVRENFTVTNGVLLYEPGPLPQGLHTFSVEVTNAAGGESHAIGRFHVHVAEAPGVLGFGAMVALGAAGLVRPGRRQAP